MLFNTVLLSDPLSLMFHFLPSIDVSILSDPKDVVCDNAYVWRWNGNYICISECSPELPNKTGYYILNIYRMKISTDFVVLSLAEKIFSLELFKLCGICIAIND